VRDVDVRHAREVGRQYLRDTYGKTLRALDRDKDLESEATDLARAYRVNADDVYAGMLELVHETFGASFD
jgi:hypothetical protein